MNSCVRLFLLMPFVFSGCTDNHANLPARFTTGLTLVAVDDAGDLIDAVSVPADGSITTVVFRLPGDTEEMHVVLWGDRIDESISGNFYFLTYGEKTGGLGEVRVEIVDGTAVVISGNGVGSPFIIPPHLIEQVQQHLDSGKSPLESTDIERR